MKTNKELPSRASRDVLACRVFARTPSRARRHRASAGITFLALLGVAVTVTGCSLDTSSNAAPGATSTSSSLNSPGKDYLAAQTLQNAGHCDRAIPLYLKAIRGNSQYVNAYLGLAGCYQGQGSPNAAITEYNKAISVDPRNFFLYYQRAGAEVSLGMNGQATLDYNTALQLAPPVVETYRSIAQEFSGYGNFADAVKAESRAIDLSPNTPIFYEERGNIYLTARQYTDAYNDYKKAISVASYKTLQASVYSALTNVYAGQGDYDAAFMAIHTAITLQPGNAHLYVQSGDIHRDAGADHYTSAIELYRKALTLVQRGDDVRAAHEGIGDVLANEGKTAEAIGEYQQAIRFTKVPAGLKAKIKQLRQPGQS
jgi:tetratricopeptide (TPR) repeat protein